ncbi:hypothetical protein [Streptomyces sp. NPDC087300]|uniref:hypothetical protein n=1 Tax=Streptomyces sp. NPDC087300 TaxID=3365780 RepID=UPI003824CBA3
MLVWWETLPDSARRQWTLDPFVSVGPLRFGMSPEEVTGALRECATGVRQYTRPVLAEGRYGSVRGDCREFGLMLFYGPGGGLQGISVDALKGPQVAAAGRGLVGRAPSGLEQWMINRSERRKPDLELIYLEPGLLGSRTLGVVIALQRTGDRLLSRPVFLPSEAMDDPYFFLPAEAWPTR